MTTLEGRVAVVTGGSRGIGLAIAKAFRAAGAHVVIAARKPEGLAAARTELLADDGGGEVLDVVANAGEPDQARACVDATMARFGRVDVLVNNAALSGSPDASEESAEDMADVLSVNLVAPFHLAKLVAETGGAGTSIVNVASILGLVSGAPLGGAGYSASKAGLIGLTRELAGQWGPSGVRVNALAPGWFRTEMTAGLFADERSARWVDRNTMLRRPGGERELDGALVFLASGASSYCTGQVLVVDGGWTAR
ncbi:SDR family NAD(P)-dependent oxidoreductase [Saccharothrix deserti]|uniref:SDR family NAD(P)-dependent oxidoreductase n=1 Tax=Saccharothrix deserti TaxID=2593674 RepID=UPI00131B13FB|nr:SDR family oxidoreductase [Saccharothrix deserti]